MQLTVINREITGLGLTMFRAESAKRDQLQKAFALSGIMQVYFQAKKKKKVKKQKMITHSIHRLIPHSKVAGTFRERETRERERRERREREIVFQFVKIFKVPFHCLEFLFSLLTFLACIFSAIRAQTAGFLRYCACRCYR